MDFFSTLWLSAPKAHLSLRGELDAFAARPLRCRLDEGVDRGNIFFDVDASAVSFVDAGGLGMLVWLSNAVRPYGGAVTVVAASQRFAQVAALAGLGDEFGLDLLPDPLVTRPVVRLTTTDGQSGCRLREVRPRAGNSTAPMVGAVDSSRGGRLP